MCSPQPMRRRRRGREAVVMHRARGRRPISGELEGGCDAPALLVRRRHRSERHGERDQPSVAAAAARRSLPPPAAAAAAAALHPSAALPSRPRPGPARQRAASAPGLRGGGRPAGP